ncbi:MAG TPA: DUF4845 domain-containing protein [Acidiferrobacter sp.]|nr:DUF4845 domain-containing protein [Acidiferrobacter sp.]
MSRHLQRGATFWTVLVFILMAGFIVFLAFEIVPPYIANWQVSSALSNVAERGDANAMSDADLRTAVHREFEVGYVGHMDIDNDLHIEHRQDGDRMLVFSYDVRVPIFYNITAIIHFVDRNKVPAP